ncbi:TetR/AcrR family transcriptional regulator [Caldimonas thermodepolymerans]|uniref:TetR/AcrR family transcriptional regulator n=1 Tax=Caldimonas thermodepolymerans TaxID=215580 RepID=UPI0022366CCF|nr:TetR/AcrR family transcriptional regulator [Caldimonas thermodepolymerans]UZG45979.1 TetR/AcrR family transcriptional regulator [Caldimonas thermodepolymerans]
MPSRPSTHDQILQSASVLFLAQGFDATSMDQVRQHAGVSNGSLYHHFPTKNHLARALYEAALADFHASLLQAIRSDPDAEAGVRGLVAAYLGWVLKHPDRARVLHELRRTTAIAGVEPDWGALNAPVYAALRAWVAGRVERREMKPMPFAVWIALVFAPLLQLTPHWLRADKPAVPRDLRALLADAAWAAVGSLPPGDAR